MDRLKQNQDYIRLPFGQKRKTDPITWTYRHKVGLLTTVLIHLVIIMIFLTYQIIIHPVPIDSDTVVIPDEALEELLKPEETEKQEVEVIEADMSKVEKAKNRISDVNAEELDASIPDHRHSNVQEIYNEAKAVQQSLSEGQESYNKAMAEINAMENWNKDKKKEEQKESSQKQEKKSVKHQGNVTVSYDLEGRTDEYLYIPAYECEGAGIVVVSIAVDINGNVKNAAVTSTTSTSNDCINEKAVHAALSSKFNVSLSAPNPQKGYIRYQFEAQ